MVPDPLSWSVCGEFVALSCTVIVPEKLPGAVGWNDRLKVHENPAAIGVEQLFCCWKTGEEKSIPCIVSGAIVTFAFKAFVPD